MTTSFNSTTREMSITMDMKQSAELFSIVLMQLMGGNKDVAVMTIAVLHVAPTKEKRLFFIKEVLENAKIHNKYHPLAELLQHYVSHWDELNEAMKKK